MAATSREEQLEAELSEVRAAFEEYIQSSQKLEDGLDNELSEMREKLASSAAANEVLANQLEKMEPLLSELETSLASSKTKLKEESRLRRQSEIAQVEMEARHDESAATIKKLQGDNETLREECNALHEELEFKCRELDKLKKADTDDRKQLRELGSRLSARFQQRDGSNASTSGSTAHTEGSRTQRGGGSTVDDSYAEVLDELEGVTEQLIATQQKLWATEDKLRESESRGRLLEASHKQMERETDDGAQNSLADSTRANRTASRAGRKLSQKIDIMKLELENAKAVARGAKTGVDKETLIEILKRQVDSLKDAAHETEADIEKFQVQLEESMDENATLVEEVACLREILQDANASHEKIRSSVVAETSKTREKEINVLREKLRNIVKENARLQQTVDQLEKGVPPSFVRKEEVSTLKKEITKLKASLKMEEEEKKHAMEKAASIWKMKMDQMTEEMDGERDLVMAQMRGEMMEKTSAAMETLSDEKYALEQKVDALESEILRRKEEGAKYEEHAIVAAEDLKATRDEVTSLKKKCAVLTTDVEHTKRSLLKAESDALDAQEKYAEVCAELEVARQILDEAGLEEETIARESETELKRQIHSLSKSLEQVRQDYAELENDFLDSQHRFHDSQEDASRKTEDEIQYLTNKISDMERALEGARTDHSVISSKLEEARKECHEALKKGERRGRENAERALKAQHGHERKLLLEKLDGMTEIPTSGMTSEGQGHQGADPAGPELSELSSQLETLSAELKECKAELESTKTENGRLLRELKGSKVPGLAGLTGVKVLDKFFGGGASTSRVAPDPEPVEDGEGIEVIQTTAKDTPTWMARDPPSEANSYLARATSVTDAQSPDFMLVRSQLIDVTLENEFLKEKIVSMGQSPEIADSSSKAVSAEVKDLIRSLEEALESSEKTSEELEAMSQKLIVSESKLAAAEEALNSSQDENKALRNEVLMLKDSVREVRRNLDTVRAELKDTKSLNNELKAELDTQEREIAKEIKTELTLERGDDFRELREQFRAITEEKAALQHQLDDAKIALSVAEYAQERNKEELKASETNLSSSLQEIASLKAELESASRSLSDLKGASLNAEDGSAEKNSALSRQMKQLVEDNNCLQQVVKELEEALEVSQEVIAKKSHQNASMHNNLVSAQEETRLLAQEVADLANAYEVAKAEYNTVVGELETVNELFEQAREEAEQNGKEAAMEEIRQEMKSDREKERKAMKIQVKKVFEENAILQRKLEEVQAALNSTKALKAEVVDSIAIKKELKVLQDALKDASKEVRTLREREFSLGLELKDTQSNLQQTEKELEIATQNYNKSMETSASRTPSSVIEQLRTEEEKEERKVLREHLKRVLSEAERNPSANGMSETSKAEALKLKVELLDMSMSLERIMKENTILEDELGLMGQNIVEARKEGEAHGRMQASKEVRNELRLEREREMREFKAKFNELVEENASIGQKLRDSDIQLALTMNSQHHGTGELVRLQAELDTAKAETTKLQQEVFDLTVELETTKDDHEQAVKELQAASKGERESKVKNLQHKLNALTIENTTLQQKLRSAETRLEATRVSEARSMEQMESLVSSLRESQSVITTLEEQVLSLKGDLRAIKANNKELTTEKAVLEGSLEEVESALKSAKSGTDKNVEDLSEALRLSREENSKLKAQADQLKRTLESSSKELDQLRDQFNRVYNEASNKSNSEATMLREQMEKLAEDKAKLQQQVDEAKMTLSIHKYSQDRNVEELKIYQERLQSSKEQSSVQKVHLTKLQAELSETKGDLRDAMDVMRNLSQLLDTVEGFTVAPSTIEDSVGHRAEEIRSKVSEIIAMLRKAREEQSSLKSKLKLAEEGNKLAEKRTAASEATLEKIRQAQLKDKMELELSELKHAEAKKEAAGYKNDINRLKTALEYAQSDHTSLRQQLEHMNLRVAQMCAEAEARGKASAAEELRVGQVDGKDRMELMAQFKRFYEENLALQGKLNEMEMALATAKASESKQKAALQQMEREAKETNEKAGKLESVNKRLNQELDSLREDLDMAKQNRSAVVKELGLVKDRLTEMTSSKTGGTAEAEIRLLQDQFKHLSAKSLSLGQKVIDAEKAMSRMTNKKRDFASKDQDFVQLSAAMGNRVSVAEEHLNKLEHDISVAKGKLQVTETGLHVLQRQQKGDRFPITLISPGRESGRTEEDSSIQSESNAHSESREDTNDQSAKRPDLGVPQKPKAKKDTNLTSRALDAIAQSKKKNTLRKLDIRSEKAKKILGPSRFAAKKAPGKAKGSSPALSGKKGIDAPQDQRE